MSLWSHLRGDSVANDECFVIQGYEGERNTDPNSKKIAQAKQGLDRNANKKKKKKKMAAVEEGPSTQRMLNRCAIHSNKN